MVVVDTEERKMDDGEVMDKKTVIVISRSLRTKNF